MIKNNLFAQILIGLLVVFLLIGSVQLFGWGQGISEISIDPDNHKSLPKLPSGKTVASNEDSTDNKLLVDNITTRPIFSNDRSRFIPEDDPIDGEDKNKPEEEINELKAKLTGVVITPEQSYAMILDNLTKERNTYKVGMPLDGEQGGWTLTEIQSRKVVFESDDSKSEELALEVYAKPLKAAKQNTKGKGKGNRNGKKQDKKNTKPKSRKDKKKNADDIRKKIAERRAQMRADAANRKQNQ